MSSGPGVVLDAGVFIALERRNRVVVHLVDRMTKARLPLITSAGVVAQVWRGGAGSQIPITFLLRHTQVIDLTSAVARTIGRMLGHSGTTDPVDAHVVLLARGRGWPVLTSDPGNLLTIDPGLVIERV